LTERAEALFLGGLVAGEGYFSCMKRRETFANGSPRLRFRFGISMAVRDRSLLESLRQVLGAGHLYEPPAPRDPRHQRSVTFSIDAVEDHKRATIPFAELFLPPSLKRAQFESWRAALLAYERERPTGWGRGASTCSMEECDRPVRGRGLCRSHYYRATGY
jgi:hypothetical protein